MRLFFFLFIIMAGTATAQQVPSKMTVAGVKVTLTHKLREELQKEVDALTASPKYFNIKVDRAKTYFPVIEEIFAEENVPDDIKYLVLQESALIPDAVSVSDAVGYWQFKDFTAMEMGLRVDNRIDERMHIIASTRSAARYLKKNYAYFNNWIYAVQAYQMGAGGAMKVVDKDHYGARSMHLDHNTYWYIKKYIAHKIAFEPAVNGSGEIMLTTYEKASNKSLQEVAKEMSVDYENLVAYNAWLRRGKVPDDRVYPVIIPVTAGSATRRSIEADISERKPSAVPVHITVSHQDEYPVKSEKNPLFSTETVQTYNGIRGKVAGEKQSVLMLAEAGGISLNRFLKYNDIGVSHKPVKGQVYYFKRKKAKAQVYHHVVMPGETLWEISQKYGIRVKRLMHKNRLLAGDKIKPGLVLWLRYVRPAHIPAEYKTLPKTPEEKVPEEVLLASNETRKDYKPEPREQHENRDTANVAGELPAVDITPADSVEDTVEAYRDEEMQLESPEFNENGNISHIVAPGETLYFLSKKYNVRVVDIITWNNLKATDKLSLGQELKILQQKNVNPEEEPLNLRDKQNYATHIVEAGETLYKIAGKYEVKVEELMKWNGKSDYNLQVGEILQIKK